MLLFQLNQSVVKPAITVPVELPKKSNPLRNSAAKIALNPYHAVVKKREESKKIDKKLKIQEVKRQHAVSKQFAARRKEFYKAAVAEGETTF